MREPKYQLNKQDAARWQELVSREAAQLGKPKKRFPPLNAVERAELEGLQRKQNRKIWAHPRMQKVRAMNRKRDRRLRRLAARVEALLARLNNNVDSAQ